MLLVYIWLQKWFTYLQGKEYAASLHSRLFQSRLHFEFGAENMVLKANIYYKHYFNWKV
jgi:hypothetical protein